MGRPYDRGKLFLDPYANHPDPQYQCDISCDIFSLLGRGLVKEPPGPFVLYGKYIIIDRGLSKDR